MFGILSYIIASVGVVSAISLIGVFTLGIRVEKLKSFLIYMLAFAAGALLADVFIHILPEIGSGGISLSVSLSILGGLLLFFIVEKFLHWQHCHMPITKSHTHPFAYMNLIGDGIHNFLDGAIIAASYVASVPLGIATTLAVILHEIPQEIGDFGVLLHGGFSKAKALLMNFATALLAVIGAVVGYLATNVVGTIEPYILGVAAGGFIYIASADLIPELHKEQDIRRSALQVFCFIIGIAVMGLLLFFE